jgi:hypothetical protein
MATWPLTLPQAPLAEGYQESPGETVIRTPMDVGPPKQRRANTAGVKQWTVTWELEASQVETFQTFFEETLEGGALSFELPHPRIDGSAVTVRFVKPPTWRPVSGDAWQVQAVLEVLP